MVLCGACGLGCCAAGACCGAQASGRVRLNYALLLLLASLLSTLMMASWAQERVEDAFGSIWFEGADPAAEGGTEAKGFGALAIYRIMTGQVAFSLLLAAATLGVRRAAGPRGTLHNGVWLPKCVGWAGCVAAAFFLPNALLEALAVPYMAAAGLFLLWQCAFFINKVNRLRLHTVDEEASRCWAALLVAATAGCYLWVAFVAAVAVAVGASGCTEAVVPGVAGLALSAAASCLAVAPRVRDAANGDGGASGLFQAAAVSAYCMYLVMSAMLNHPEAACRPLGGGASEPWVRAASLLLTLLVYTYGVTDLAGLDFRTGAKPGGGGGGTYGGHAADPEQGGAEGGAKSEAKAPGEKGKGEGGAADYSYAQFHLAFALGAACIVMVLTGWAELDGLAGGEVALVRSAAAVWVARGTALACYALYAATLVLPPLCPSRRFGSKAAPAAAGAAGAGEQA